MLKRWLLYCSVLVAAIIFYSIYLRYLSYYILLVALALPIFSLIVSLPGMILARVSIEPVGGIVRRGDDAVVNLRLSARSVFPTSRVKIYYSAENTGISARAKTRTLSVYGSIRGTAEITVDTSHCGCITLEVKKFLIYDYLGLFALPKHVADYLRVHIYPTPEKPEPMPVLPQGEVYGSNLRPKYGGGFAEDHDLRMYRVGDAMNSVHWKLSSKLDELIVREPLVYDKGKICVFFDAFGTPEEIDSSLGQVDYLAERFFSSMTEFFLCRYEPSDEEPVPLVSTLITCRDDYIKYLGAILSVPMPRQGVTVAGSSFRYIDWFYLVRPRVGAKESGTEEKGDE